MDKIKKIFSGVTIGIIFIIVGTIMLWINEGNNVNNIKTTNQLTKEVIDISSDKIDSSNNGKLVCVSGKLSLQDTEATDSVFNISVKSPKLVRTVEVYQWVEDVKDSENDTYSYTKEWKEELINSDNFNDKTHQNPNKKDFESENNYSSKLTVGSFELSKSQKESLSTSTTLKDLDSAKIPDNYKVVDEYITNSEDINSPQIGDVRISFTYNSASELTILAVQNENTFSDFESKAGKKINRVEEEILTSKQVIERIEKENKILKWVLRVAGGLIIIIGYLLLISPIAKLTSFIPILGKLVGMALSGVCISVGLIHSFAIIIIAWFRYRPVLSIILLVIIFILILVITKLVKKQKAQ